MLYQLSQPGTPFFKLNFKSKWGFFLDYIYLFILKYFMYLSMRDTERERQAEGEAAPCREPDAGLDPRTPGSRPEPEADAQALSHPGAPSVAF